MNKRRFFGRRFGCLLLILFMIFAGMRTEIVRADSFLASPVSCAASIRSVSAADDIVLYRGAKLMELAEKCAVEELVRRTTHNLRIVQWLWFAILPAVLLGQSLPVDSSVFPREACENQYRQRTLNYIHHMDGKKA